MPAVPLGPDTTSSFLAKSHIASGERSDPEWVSAEAYTTLLSQAGEGGPPSCGITSEHITAVLLRSLWRGSGGGGKDSRWPETLLLPNLFHLPCAPDLGPVW